MWQFSERVFCLELNGTRVFVFNFIYCVSNCGTCWKLNGCNIFLKMRKHTNHAGIILNYVPMVSSVLLNYQPASCPWQYQDATSTQSITVRHTLTQTLIYQIYSFIYWMRWSLSLKTFHYSHVQLICVRLNGSITHWNSASARGKKHITVRFSHSSACPAIRHLLQSSQWDSQNGNESFPNVSFLSLKWSQWLNRIKTECNRPHSRRQTNSQRARGSSSSSHLLHGHEMTALIISEQHVCADAAEQSRRKMNPTRTVLIKYYKQNNRSWVALTCITGFIYKGCSSSVFTL